MTGDAADLLNAIADRFTVESDLYQFLYISELFALALQISPEAGPVYCELFCHCSGECFPVDPGLHQQSVGHGINRNRGGDALFIPGYLVKVISREGSMRSR